jgi:hypothetical protein
MIFPSVIAIVRAGSGLGAGPATTAPVLIENLLPWQGQSMVPPLTASHRHPTCVQMALNALYCPFAGWVTTTLAAVKIVPPPTGTCVAWPRTVPVIPPLDPAAAEPGPADVAAAAAAPGACPSSLAS